MDIPSMPPNRLTKRLLDAGLALSILAALFAAYRFHFLLFHSVAEVFSVIIACGMFMLAWNSRRLIENHYLLFLGIAYLFVALLDLAHTFTYKGMNILPGYGPNTPTQLWIAARYMESLSLLAAPLMFFRRVHPERLLAGYGLMTALVLASVFTWDLFPDCFDEDAGGLTAFKIVSEYVICLILVAAGLLILRFRRKFSASVLSWMLASLGLTALAELAFTTYASVYGLSNMVGHVFKIGSFYCVYKALIETGLEKPYELMFRDLMLSREDYRALFTHMTVGFARHRMVYDQAGRPVDYRFLQVNEAFERLTGLRDVTGRLATEVIPGIREDPADWIGVYGRVATHGEPLHFESHARSLDRWYSIDAYSPSRGDFVTVFADITQRVRDEEERRRQSESLRLSEARFKLLSGTAGRLLATDHPRLLVDDLCRSVMEHLDCQAFFNFLVDESAGRLRLNAWAGIPEQEAREIQWLDYGTTVSGCVALEQRRIVAEDIASRPDRRTDLIRGYGIQAYCCHPLMIGNRLIGTLSFGTRTRTHFAPDEVDLMRTVANQVALAMQRVETENVLRSVNEDLERKVRERTARLTDLIETLEGEISGRELVEEKLRRANLELTEQAEQLRRMAGELTMAERRERRRLSRVLHDGMQQYLAAAKMRLGRLVENLTDEDRKKAVTDIEAAVDESIRIARSLSAELSPPALYEGGLPAGLDWLAHWMREKHGLEVDLVLETIADPPEHAKILVFESVRELLFNTVKHAGVSRARVRLESMDGRGARVTVSDPGGGFDASGLEPVGPNGRGFGLFSIRERLGLIGGSLEIASAPGGGSRFTVTFPYEPVPAQSVGKKDPGSRPAAGPERTRPRKIPGTLRVLIVDDHPLFREGLTELLNAKPDIEVVGHAGDGLQAWRQARKLTPDTILMDINMPEMNGIDATRRIHAEMPGIRIVGLSMNEDPDSRRAMIEAGAAGYINKGCPASELLAAIRACTPQAPPPAAPSPDGEQAGRPVR